MAATSRVWLITGTSSGFGRALVLAVLKRGDRVIASARNLDKIQDFPKTDDIRLLRLDLDWDEHAIQAAVDEAIAFWGKVDVLVNNAGTNTPALIEGSLGRASYKKVFQTNFFGQMDVTQALLPHMRERRTGTVVLMGSRSSWRGQVPFMGAYCASKSALRIFGETLSAEVAQFSIRVVVLEPGGFRTTGIGRLVLPDNGIADYEEMRKQAQDRFEESVGNFHGDPDKAMELVADVVRGEGKAEGKESDVYLPMGTMADTDTRAKCLRMIAACDTWKDIQKTLDLDEE